MGIWQIVSKALKLVIAFESSVLLAREEAKERIKSVQRFRKMMSIRSLFIRMKMRSVSSRGGSGRGQCPWPRHRMRAITDRSMSEPDWHSGSRCLWSTYNMPGTVLGAWQCV